MPKAQEGTAKYVSNLQKINSLQKLKFYCQICSKQCRDKNGFINHTNSPSHQAKISQVSSSQITKFSQDFTKDFLSLLKINHGEKLVDANKFYQEYILNDRNHIHMNSTRWSSLTAFVLHLKETGSVKVEGISNDDNDYSSAVNKGLSIGYIDRSASKLAREAEARKKEKKLVNDEVIQMRLIEEQVKKGKEREAKEKSSEEVKTLSESDGKPVKLSLKAGLTTGLKPISFKKRQVTRNVFGDDQDEEDEEKNASTSKVKRVDSVAMTVIEKDIQMKRRKIL